MDVLDIFKKITTIPHCSKRTEKLREFISSFAKRYNFFVQIDEAGNILCFKEKREICLQSHYDMVCVGQAPRIELYEENGYLKAKDSSLGADNGVGIAIMLKLISEGKEAEYLFSNDEEVGLIGASQLALELQAKKMINLDSEEFGAIYVGCAGGVDIVARRRTSFQKTKKKFFYAITSKNFPGGHSGVDIDKQIPNAIKEAAFFVQEAELGSMEAGERRNSIPVGVKAKVATDSRLQSSNYFEVRECEPFEVIDVDLITLLKAFSDGVRGWEKEFDIPSKSANLAKVFVDNNRIEIEVSLRANSNDVLKRLAKEYEAFFTLQGMDVEQSGWYPVWEPKVSSFAKEVAKVYEKFYKDVRFKAIHAGLESSLFALKYPDMQIVSIGPTIEYPHSTSEQVKIDTIDPIYQIVKEIV